MTFRKSQPSQTLILNEISQQMTAAGKTVYRYGFGQSPFTPPQRVQDALQEAVLRVEYAPVQGIAALREKIADFHTHEDGVATQPEQIVVASGSKILLLNTMMAFENADVLLTEPTWVSYAAQAKIIGHQVHRVPTTYAQRWRIDPAQLDAQLATLDNETSKILVLNYPGNPDGLTYHDDELAALAEVFRKYGVWVLADEIYGMLHHTGAHKSLRAYYPERTLVTTGLSKWCGAGGWRLGVELLPPDVPDALRDSLLAISSSSYSCAPTPIQVAAVQAYTWDADTQAYLQHQRQILRILGQHLYALFTAAEIAVYPPEGGFYFLLDFSPLRDRLASRGITTDNALCEKLLQDTGVILLPGSAFGMAPETLTARLAFVDFNGTQLLDALRNHATPPDDATFAPQVIAHCQHLLEGIDKLTTWLS